MNELKKKTTETLVMTKWMRANQLEAFLEIVAPNRYTGSRVEITHKQDDYNRGHAFEVKVYDVTTEWCEVEA